MLCLEISGASANAEGKDHCFPVVHLVDVSSRRIHGHSIQFVSVDPLRVHQTAPDSLPTYERL
jgi:hypothetical protein